MLRMFMFKSNTTISNLDGVNMQSSSVSAAQNSTINPTSNALNSNWHDTAMDSIINAARSISDIVKNFLFVFLYSSIPILRRETSG